jgi:alginate O-acetyltransferase complex protein AlgI
VLFHTTQFLDFFLITFAVYWALPFHRARMLFLLAASCYFYMSWNPWLISLILFSASVDYLIALRLARTESPRTRLLLVVLSVTVNLSLLGFFKYTNFFLGLAHTAARTVGIRYKARFLSIVLPLGISFYTFETISYIVDVYRRRIAPERSVLNYALYIMFFPHLISGPIIRPRDFLGQLAREKRFDWQRFVLGVELLLAGLVKKVLIADRLAKPVDLVFHDPHAYSSGAVWLAALAYTGQIYCDFSGYTDMAIGLAHMLGFKLKPNFNMPYLAKSLTEFWRRWHISLSTWLRDYLYIPLGGSRGSRLETHRNLLLTMLLGGLWHGADARFVLWGLYHGLWLSLERAFPSLAQPRSLPAQVLGWARTLLAVIVGWVFFRAQSFSDALEILRKMFLPEGGLPLGSAASVVLVCVAAIVAAHLAARRLPLGRLDRTLPAPLIGFGMAVVLVLISALREKGYTAFIYFQF